MSNPSLILPQSPAYGEDYVYAAQVNDGVVPLYNVLPLTFTRASNGTRINKDGILENMPYNLLQQSENIGTSPWLTNGSTLTSGQTDPSGDTTAVKVELASGGNNYVYQGITIPQGTNIVSAYLRADSATTIGFSMGGSTPNAVNLTTSWQLFTFSSANTSGGIIFDNYFGPSPTQQAKTFYIWHPQFNIGSTAQPYLATTDRLNMPRITYPVGGGCGALLLEKQSTNVLTYSEDFSNAVYTKRNSTIGSNVTTSPDGTTNADKIQEDTSNARHDIYTGFTCTNGVTYTQTIFAKQGERRYCFMTFGTALLNPGDSFFDLQDGVVVSSPSGVTSSIENMGNGWYRCRITTICVSDGTGYFVNGPAITGSNYIYQGVSGYGIYVYGAQIEASSYATSYIPTTSTSATRIADAGTTSLSSSIVNATEGVLFLDFQPLNIIDSYPVDFQLQYNGSNAINGVTIYQQGNTPSITVRSGNSIIFSASLTATTAGTRNKIAVAYKANDFAVYQNGVQKATQTSGVAPAALNELRLSDGTRNFSINYAEIFTTRLTNAELATLTTI